MQFPSLSAVEAEAVPTVVVVAEPSRRRTSLSAVLPFFNTCCGCLLSLRHVILDSADDSAGGPLVSHELSPDECSTIPMPILPGTVCNSYELMATLTMSQPLSDFRGSKSARSTEDRDLPL